MNVYNGDTSGLSVEQSDKKYVTLPAWVWVFVVINLLLPVLPILAVGEVGFFLPIFFGLVGAMLCVRVLKTSLPVFAKFFRCVVITLTTWMFFFVLLIFVVIFIAASRA